VTEGGDGALAVTERVQVRVGAPEVKIHDTVGAGDSFTAALLAGILRLGEQLGAPLTEAVDRVHQPLLTAVVAEAVAAASLTCTRVGADPPTGEELRRWLGTGGP
jgi:fructokinase